MVIYVELFMSSFVRNLFGNQGGHYRQVHNKQQHAPRCKEVNQNGNKSIRICSSYNELRICEF